MVPIITLWLPIVLSAVLVFVASSIMHMVLTYHRSDYRKMPKEDQVMDALRAAGAAPGDYFVPHGGGPAALKDPAFIEKMTRGPVALVTVAPSGPPTMTVNLIQWFLYCLLIGAFAAYIAGRALGPGADYASAFRFAGAAAFSGYALALIQNSIWARRPWGTTAKHLVDGLIYGLLTGGAFGWLWPR